MLWRYAIRAIPVTKSPRRQTFLNAHPQLDAFAGWHPRKFIYPQLWLQQKIWLKRGLAIVWVFFLIVIHFSFAFPSSSKIAEPVLHKDMFLCEGHKHPLCGHHHHKGSLNTCSRATLQDAILRFEVLPVLRSLCYFSRLSQPLWISC